MILVVSTDAEIRGALASTLEAFGTVATAESTAEGLREADDAAVVVLDLLAPGIDGEAFASVSAPIVVVGAHEVRPTLIGPDRFVKAFTLAVLHETVAEIRAARAGAS